MMLFVISKITGAPLSKDLSFRTKQKELAHSKNLVVLRQMEKIRRQSDQRTRGHDGGNGERRNQT